MDSGGQELHVSHRRNLFILGCGLLPDRGRCHHSYHLLLRQSRRAERKQMYADHCKYTAIIFSAKIFAVLPWWRVFVALCYFEFEHSSTQTKRNAKQDIYLKGVILALSWGSSVKIAKIECLLKYQLYSISTVEDFVSLINPYAAGG